MSRAELAFPALILVTVSALLCAGFLVLDYSWTVIAFPFGTGIVLCVLCLLQLASAARGRWPRSGAGDLPEESVTPSSIAWVLALPLFIYGVGFVLGPAIFLLAYFKAHGFSWRFSSALAAGSAIVTWGLFIKLLGILLPMQPLWLS
jgi:hypothetical protein